MLSEKLMELFPNKKISPGRTTLVYGRRSLLVDVMELGETGKFMLTCSFGIELNGEVLDLESFMLFTHKSDDVESFRTYQLENICKSVDLPLETILENLKNSVKERKDVLKYLKEELVKDTERLAAFMLR